MIPLDTDAISHLVRRPDSAPPAARIARVPSPHRCAGSLTVGELLYGLARARGGPGLRAELQARAFDRIVVLPFDFEAAEEYARLRALLERQGTPLPDADLRLASIALVHDLTLLTGNERYFRRGPGLRGENRLREEAHQSASP